MRARLWYGLAAFAIASVLNPGYFVGCAASTDDEPKFQYGAKEMTEFALLANDSYEFDDDSEQYRIDLDIEPERADPRRAALEPGHPASAFAATAHACGERKLFASAAACVDSSSMELAGTFTLLRIRNGAQEVIASDVPVTGKLLVYSLVLEQATLSLGFDGGSLQLSGIYRDSFKLGAHQISALLDKN